MEFTFRPCVGLGNSRQRSNELASSPAKLRKSRQASPTPRTLPVDLLPGSEAHKLQACAMEVPGRDHHLHPSTAEWLIMNQTYLPELGAFNNLLCPVEPPLTTSNTQESFLQEVQSPAWSWGSSREEGRRPGNSFWHIYFSYFRETPTSFVFGSREGRQFAKRARSRRSPGLEVI